MIHTLHSASWTRYSHTKLRDNNRLVRRICVLCGMLQRSIGIESTIESVALPNPNMTMPPVRARRDNKNIRSATTIVLTILAVVLLFYQSSRPTTFSSSQNTPLTASALKSTRPCGAYQGGGIWFILPTSRRWCVFVSTVIIFSWNMDYESWRTSHLAWYYRSQWWSSHQREGGQYVHWVPSSVCLWVELW